MTNKLKTFKLEPLVDGEFMYNIPKKVKNPKLLADVRMYYGNKVSFGDSINKYISKNQKKWNLKKNEKVGYVTDIENFWFTPEYNKERRHIVFYRIN